MAVWLPTMRTSTGDELSALKLGGRSVDGPEPAFAWRAVPELSSPAISRAARRQWPLVIFNGFETNLGVALGISLVLILISATIMLVLRTLEKNTSINL